MGKKPGWRPAPYRDGVVEMDANLFQEWKNIVDDFYNGGGGHFHPIPAFSGVWESEPVNNNRKDEMSELRNLSKNQQEMLSEDDKALLRVDFIDRELDWTERAWGTIKRMMIEEYKEKLVAKAKEIIKEEEEKEAE